MASLIFSWVLVAVCPTYPATRADRSTSTSCPLESTPICLYNLARIRATVVFPVPGFPLKTRCRETGTDFKPRSRRIFCIFTRLMRSATSFLILSRPTRAFKSSIGSVSSSAGTGCASGESVFSSSDFLAPAEEAAVDRSVSSSWIFCLRSSKIEERSSRSIVFSMFFSTGFCIFLTTFGAAFFSVFLEGAGSGRRTGVPHKSSNRECTFLSAMVDSFLMQGSLVRLGKRL